MSGWRAAEGGQEIRPSFAIARGPFEAADPYAVFDEAPLPRVTDKQETDDHFYQGVLSVVLRLVFLLYAEDQALIPPDSNLTCTAHLSLFGLYDRLSHDVGAHPESMHQRFGAYGQLLSLFRAVFFGVRHGKLQLPPRRGRLFDPNTYPFLEGGQPDWQDDFCPAALKEALEQAVDLRQQILALADHEDPSSQNEKRRLFEFSQQSIDRIRMIADVCVGAFTAGPTSRCRPFAHSTTRNAPKWRHSKTK
ncbi:MAG TPA: hypothetical protein VKP30_02530 [Polyangiaceae bacterium]|nr:hypothetical protein [Polyangiaceae bacterium]